MEKDFQELEHELNAGVSEQSVWRLARINRYLQDRGWRKVDNSAKWELPGYTTAHGWSPDRVLKNQILWDLEEHGNIEDLAERLRED